jgi:cell division protein FtsN
MEVGMPLDFRSREEDGFSIKRFLKTVGAGVAVFLIFMAVGYYGLGPRITISDEGRLQLRLTNTPTDATPSHAASPDSKPMPKVVVQEKLPPDVTAGTGVIIGSREVAPFDYERYQQKRRERQPKPNAAPDETPADEPPPIDDEYFVPDESMETPAPESSTPQPEPPPTDPTPPQEPVAPTSPQTETQASALYRVQVGVYESRENANQVVQSLLASGFEASIVPLQRDGKTVYRVQTLVTRDRAKAEALKSQLESKGFPAVVAKAQ